MTSVSKNVANLYDPHKALNDIFGFNKFKGDQLEVIENVLNGNDSFVIMPTGAGKSL